MEERFPLKMSFVELNGFYMRAIGVRICNKRMRFSCDMVGNVFEGDPSPALRPRSSSADEMVGFSRQLADKGIPFLHVMVPLKLDVDGALFPAGWNGRNPNREAEAFVSDVQARGVRVLDLIPILAGTAKDVQANYFSTDHHWRFRTALRAAALTADRLADILQEPMLKSNERLKPEAWIWKSIPRCFLGSQGRRTGCFFASAEDFEYAVPKFPNRMTRFIPSKRYKVAGDFGKAEMLSRFLKTTRRNRYVNRYGLYTGSDEDIQVHANVLAPVRKRLMLVKDSFGNPVSAFLATVFRSVIQVDPRKLPDGVMVMDVVEKYRPDVVVELVNPGFISSWGMGMKYEELR